MIQPNLPAHITTAMDDMPEVAMGCHIVDFTLKDGRVLERVTVVGQRYARLPAGVSGDDIVSVGASASSVIHHLVNTLEGNEP